MNDDESGLKWWQGLIIQLTFMVILASCFRPLCDGGGMP